MSRPRASRRWAYAAAERLALPLARRRAEALAREDCERSQRQALERILQAGRGTAFAREHALAGWRELGALPVQGYEGLLPYVERSLRGEKDVLAPGTVPFWAVSSGTTSATTKYLPVNRAMVANFRRGGLDTLYLQAARASSAGIFGGRQLFLGGSTALDPVRSDPRALAGDLSGIMALHMPRLVERLFYAPGRDLAHSTDWQAKVRAIAERVVDQDIRLVAGIPSWLLVLFEQVREVSERRGARFAHLHDVWPRLEVIVHGGVRFDPYRGLFERWLGRPVAFQEVYPASEAFVAVQDGPSGEGLRLLTDAGVYYEFLPAGDLGPDGLPLPGARPLPLAEVSVGRDYAIVLTTPGGLWRYLLGDVVRFVATKPPRLQFVGRTRLELTAFGEHVIEAEVVHALTAAANRFGLAVRDFTVAPVFPAAGDPTSRGRHQWLIELDGAVPAPAEAVARSLDGSLQARNDDYRGKRDGGGMAAPEVVWLPAGTFRGWMAGRGRLGGQNKVPRLRSDREAADGVLASVAAVG